MQNYGLTPEPRRKWKDRGDGPNLNSTSRLCELMEFYCFIYNLNYMTIFWLHSGLSGSMLHSYCIPFSRHQVYRLIFEILNITKESYELYDYFIFYRGVKY